MIKKILLSAIISCTFVVASDLYTDTYMSQSGIVKPHIDTGISNGISGNVLMQKRIYSSASLYFKRGKLTSQSVDAIHKMVDTINLHKSRRYYISIIGHTAGYTDSNHMVELSPWAEFWQNISYRRISRDTLVDSVNRRILAVYNTLKDNSISPARIYTENRLDRDPIVTEATTEGRQTNNRVDVTLYY